MTFVTGLPVLCLIPVKSILYDRQSVLFDTQTACSLKPFQASLCRKRSKVLPKAFGPFHDLSSECLPSSPMTLVLYFSYNKPLDILHFYPPSTGAHTPVSAWNGVLSFVARLMPRHPATPVSPILFYRFSNPLCTLESPFPKNINTQSSPPGNLILLM